MDAKAWIAIASALIAVLALLSTVLLALRSRAVTHGQAETSLRTLITSTRQAVRQVSLKIAELMDGKLPNRLTAEEERRIGPFAAAFAEAAEDNLNAYENACGQYIDRKVDVTRFRKMYFHEIAEICESEIPEIRQRMHPADTSEYEAIWKVYRAWHTQEK